MDDLVLCFLSFLCLSFWQRWCCSYFRTELFAKLKEKKIASIFTKEACFFPRNNQTHTERRAWKQNGIDIVQCMAYFFLNFELEIFSMYVNTWELCLIFPMISNWISDRNLPWWSVCWLIESIGDSQRERERGWENFPIRDTTTTNRHTHAHNFNYQLALKFVLLAQPIPASRLTIVDS